MFFLGARIDNINKINATTITEGPEAVFISREVNKPIIIDATPPKIENKTICLGLLLKFLAIADGIISSPVISKTPIILIDMAITPANNKVNIKFDLSGFIFSAEAKS